jgi:PAS domain S-box-containing protein
MRVTPLLDSQAGVVVAHENITERKLAEEGLRASEERLRLSLEAANQGIYDLNVQTGEALVSSGYVTMLDYDPATFRETHAAWIERLHPDDRDRVTEYYRTYVAGEIPEYRVEFRQRTRGGGWRWILSLGRIVERDARGEPLRMLGTHTDITERKRSEEDLRMSEERFQFVARATNDVIWDWDLNTDKAQWSQAFQTLFGYKHEDLEPGSASWSNRLHPDDRERVIAGIHGAIDRGEQSWSDEYRFLRADGSEAYIFDRGYILYDSAAKPERMIGSMQDITLRKRAEEALRLSEERFTLAVRGSNTGIWDWDLRTGKTYFSPLWKSMLGYEEHELRGEFFEWEERLHPDDHERSSATVRAYLEGVTSQYELEHRLRHKDGSYRWIMARGVSICDTEGKPFRMAGSHIDITEQKQTQEALVQSERQLRTVLDALPVGVWFTDRAGKPLLANPAAKQIWSNIKQIGLQTENNQTGWWESIGPANEPHRWALSQVLTTGVPSLNETFDFECLDETKKAIRNSTVPVKNQDGVILGAIVLNEDITALREAQAALQLTQFSVDHAVEGFLWIGSDARIFHVNGSICRMLDYTWEELTAMTLYDIDPNLSAGVWPAHWEELKEKGSLTFESKYWSRTGRVQDMEVTANYLQYEGKEYNCAIMRDISERKRAEEALRTSEARYRSLYDDTPIMYFTLATDGTMRSVNRFGAEQLGYQAEELIGHSVLGLFHEADREAVAASLSECLATPETTRYWEFRKLRKDGSMIWVREAARVGWSDTEETVVLVTCEDITERKQAEHESRERTRQVLAMQAARLELAHLDDTRRTFSEVLSQVTPIVANTLAVERVSLWLLSEDQTELVCQDLYLRSQATHSAGSRLAVSSYPRYLAVLKESLVIGASNAGVDQRTSEFADDYFFALGITSVLDVPIRRQGKLVGVLWCEHVGMPREWAFEAQDFGASVGQTIVRMMEASERTQAEDRLRATQYAVDHATDYIFVIGSNGYFLDVNKSACRRLGYTKDELLTKSVMDIDPDFPPATWESFWEELKHKKLLCLESRHRSKSGEIYPVEVIANYILHEGKELDYAFVRDITERKRAEKELQKSYSFLRQVIDLDPNFIFAKDREGRFTLANKAVADAYGTTVENLVGKTDADFNPNQEEVAFFRQDDLAVIDNLNELFLPEEVITDSDGRTRWLQTVKRPILDDEGCAIMVLGASTDITERKRMEETLRQRERALQMAIEERERISQDLHDGILQSLFAVGLALESAKLTMPSRNLKVFRASLNQAIDQLNDVMREIRNFIAGLGSDPLQGKDLPMALKQMLASLTEHQATRVRLAVEDRAAKALSTEQSLHLIRVIQEAVSNCIKHGHAQEARVSLKMLKRGVRLSVRDNGRGFNQDNAKRTGHGLANMAARARKIGGQFTILSKVNKGTSIVLDFPKEAADVSR